MKKPHAVPPAPSDGAAPKARLPVPPAGTVLRAFHGHSRRFRPGSSVVTDADAADLPMPLDALKERGFIS